MRKIYLPVFFIGLLLMGLATTAQDIHFSQFYASPLTLNPATVGNMEGDYRITGIYRNQWANVSMPYVTYGASYDMRLLQNKLKNDVFGAGVVITNDRSGDGKLGDLAIYLNPAFHKSLGARKKHYLGIGLQMGYVQRTLDYQSLTFPSQHSGTSFDNALPNGENIKSTKVGYFDMNVGLLWNGQLTQKLGLFHGFSAFHLTSPKESFLGDNVHLAPRFVLNGGLRYQIKPRWYITPNYIIMLQDKNREVNFGTGVEYVLGNSAKQIILGLGAWYRTHDAGVISATVEYMKVRIGLAYDVTTSALQQVPKSQGSFEISLMYNGKFPGNNIGPIMVPCPRM